MEQLKKHDTKAYNAQKMKFVTDSKYNRSKEATAEIKEWFQFAPPGEISATDASPVRNIVLRHPDHEDKESAAKEGFAKIMLWGLGGTINPISRAVDKPILGILSKSMQAIADGPKGSMGSKFKGLLTRALSTEVDPMNIMSDTTLGIIQSSLATLFINGEFCQAPVFSITGEASTISFDAFLPQIFADLSKKVENHEQQIRNEGLMNLTDNLKSMPKTTIQKLGAIEGPKSVLSGIINTLRIMESMYDIPAMIAAGGGPILYQLYTDYLKSYRTKKTKMWRTMCDKDQPQHAWNMHSELDSMMASVGMSACDFVNVNLTLASKPESELDLEGWNDAISTSLDSALKLRGLISLTAPDMSVSRLVPASIMPQAPTAATSPAAPTKKGAATGNDKKRGGDPPVTPTTTPKGKKARPAAGLGRDVNVSNTEKGFIFIKDLTMDKSKVFPADMNRANKPCPGFVCQGWECTFSSSDCPDGVHSFTPSRIPSGELDKMARHMHTKKHAWFNKNTLSKCTNHWTVPADCVNIVGNKSGPAST